MKKLNKKGFTIVELVIVIAVIGVLAGVLIPTFGGVIASANASAALQAARGCLSSALNMSSTGSLPGYNENTKKYQTVFFVDQNGDGLVDYQYFYKGNELEAVNRKDSTVNWTFNSVLMFSGSMLTTYKHTAEQVTSYTTNEAEALDANKKLNNGYTIVEDKYTLDKTAANMIFSALNYYDDSNSSYKNLNGIVTGGTGTVNKLAEVGGIDYKDYEYSPHYGYAGNSSTILDLDKSTYCTGTVEKGTGEDDSMNDYAKLGKFYLNADFSKKVIIFTTFGA